MKKIIFATAVVIVSGLVASQAIAGTCTKTVGMVTYKKFCMGPIAGWTYNPGAKEIWVPWDEVLNKVPRVKNIRIARIDTSNYILKDITHSDGKRFYRIYKNDSPVTENINSHQFDEWVLKLPPELKNYLLTKEFSSFVATNSSGTRNYKFKPVLPVAKAGNGQSVRPGETVTLDGSASSIEDPYYCPNPGGDPDACPLVYQWSFVSKPPNSKATLSGAALVKPTFVADLAGNYKLKLVVSSGEVKSKADEVIIRAYKIKRPVR